MRSAARDRPPTGVVPMVLLTQLTGQELKYTHNPPTRIKCIENLTLFLKAIKGLGVQLTNITAEDICDGKRTLILGLTWKLISHFVSNEQPEGTNEDLMES